MSARHATSRGRRVSALLLASAVVVLAWCAVGGAQAAVAAAPTATATTMSAPTGDEDSHAASVDQAPRAGAVHVVHAVPDAVPAPAVRLDAPRRLTTERTTEERGPPAEAEQATSGSRAPPV